MGEVVMDMIIKLSTLAEGVSSQVTYEYNAKRIDAEFEDMHYTTPIRFQAQMRLECATLHVWGQLIGQVEQVCARCLREVAVPVEQPVDLFYDTKDIDEIDPLEQLREILILSHELKFLCQSECLGLCPGCGADLNAERCVCSIHNIPKN